MLYRLGSAAAVAALAVALWSQHAKACGCFAPPDPSVPIVQAGERILFSVDNGVVTAQIQIQYAGEAKDFGWLLPLPSVPKLALGTEELFTRLIGATQPRYFLNTLTTGACASSAASVGVGGAVFLAAAAGETTNSFTEAPPSSPLVIESSIGPYDYAVLKADRKDEMLQWLADNRYFVPAGTQESVGPYINPGAFFLALKLKSGKAAGDIQPVVLEYPSGLPMIPIILTSVGAQEHMGLQVWMLGSGRAIPRNYNHVIVNDSQIDWLNGAQNYNDVVIAAVGEATDKHAFVTEYAGTSDVMKDALDGPSRFRQSGALPSLTDPADFVEFLFNGGYAPNSARLTPVLEGLVLAQLPLPTGVPSLTPANFLRRLRFYLGSYRTEHPDQFAGWTNTFDAPSLAAQIEEKVIAPARAAGAFFRAHPVLTRLYTTLSPEDMTRDPVFSFNAELPMVSRDHTAQLRIDCGLGGDITGSPATLTTEQGWVFHLANRGTPLELDRGPAALRIETLAEEGLPLVLVDNRALVSGATGCGCVSVEPLLVVALVAFLRRRRLWIS